MVREAYWLRGGGAVRLMLQNLVGNKYLPTETGGKAEPGNHPEVRILLGLGEPVVQPATGSATACEPDLRKRETSETIVTGLMHNREECGGGI